MRKIGGYDSNLIKVEDLEKNKGAAYDLIKKQVDNTAQFCQEKKVKYILLIHPSPSEIESKNTEGILNSTLFNSSYVINLFKPMMKFYEMNDISKYSWRINGHFNSKGYEVMGDMVFEELSLINILE